MLAGADDIWGRMASVLQCACHTANHTAALLSSAEFPCMISYSGSRVSRRRHHLLRLVACLFLEHHRYAELKVSNIAPPATEKRNVQTKIKTVQ
jgi:hypothetical protein